MESYVPYIEIAPHQDIKEDGTYDNDSKGNTYFQASSNLMNSFRFLDGIYCRYEPKLVNMLHIICFYTS